MQVRVCKIVCQMSSSLCIPFIRFHRPCLSTTGNQKPNLTIAQLVNGVGGSKSNMKDRGEGRQAGIRLLSHRPDFYFWALDLAFLFMYISSPKSAEFASKCGMIVSLLFPKMVRMKWIHVALRWGRRATVSDSSILRTELSGSFCWFVREYMFCCWTYWKFLTHSLVPNWQWRQENWRTRVLWNSYVKKLCSKHKKRQLNKSF